LNTSSNTSFESGPSNLIRMTCGWSPDQQASKTTVPLPKTKIQHDSTPKSLKASCRTCRTCPAYVQHRAPTLLQITVRQAHHIGLICRSLVRKLAVKTSPHLPRGKTDGSLFFPCQYIKKSEFHAHFTARMSKVQRCHFRSNESQHLKTE
jgi:hypothetical protein